MKLHKLTSLLLALVLGASLASAQSFTVALKNGEKVTYNNSEVDSIFFHTPDTPAEPAAAKIGDFYYSDGTWSTDLNTSKTVIGIVFRAGIASDYRDSEAYYTMKDGKTKLEKVHGYAIALRDATGLDGWDDLQWWSPFNDDAGGGCSSDYTDFLGYTNTLSIIDAAGGTLTNKNFPAAYYATTVYENAVPAPEQSSGWFLPSAGMLKYIYDRVYFDEDNSGRACVVNAMLKLNTADVDLLYRNDAEYWTSTEKIDSYGKSTWAYYVCFDARSIKPGFVADYRKNAGFAVRSVIVF
ncbi:MAG: hypothetical protein NC338_00640 [Firmicutes bacterium]|nr:hypothetical protein [Bacillota bacterium]MCM1400627.1 hypothetical protein [Bacteroides sp.]MCM1477778.1 hypothetical protein [Bacteroides sp.]